MMNLKKNLKINWQIYEEWFMINDLFKLSMTLQVLKEQRHILIKDCTEHKYELLHGLRNDVNSELYKLYSEKYTILWLDYHWNRIISIINQYIEYESDKQEIIEYFTNEFKVFLEPEGYKNTYSTELFFILLKNKLSILKDLIAIADKHEKTLQELLNAIEKHRLQYDKLIKEKMEVK